MRSVQIQLQSDVARIGRKEKEHRERERGKLEKDGNRVIGRKNVFVANGGGRRPVYRTYYGREE